MDLMKKRRHFNNSIFYIDSESLQKYTCSQHQKSGSDQWHVFDTWRVIAEIVVTVALDGVPVLSAGVGMGGRVGGTGQSDLSAQIQSETWN